MAMTREDGIVPEDGGRPFLREYLDVIRLRKWSILLVILLVVGGALLYSVRQTPKYQSEARVLVERVTEGTQTPQTINLQTEKELVTSIQVAQLAVERLEADEEPEQLLRGLAVDVVPQTEILIMRYEDVAPGVARERAQAFAQAYLDFRRKQVEEDLLAASESLGERKTDLEKDLNKLEAKLATLGPDDPQRIQTQSQINQVNSQIAVITSELSDLTPSANLQVGQIVEPARLPVEPSSPDFTQNTVLALLVGLALGVAVAFLRERLDDRLRGRPDLENHLGAPVVAVIPKVATWKRKKETPLTMISEPRSAASEAYRTLRTSLLFAASRMDAKTILVTSPQAGEGKTATSANLGAVLAQARKRVLLVSADLRKPRLHRFFGVSNDVGLTSVLIGEAKPWEAVTDVGLEYLKFLPSGPVPGNPAELLASDAMGRLLDQFREVADFVILDSAPLLVVADALTLAPFADAALFIADAEGTSRSAVMHARTQLDQVNATVIGAVLNNFDPSKAKYGRYYYSYYYAYKYEETPSRTPRLRRRRLRKDEGPYPLREAGAVTGFEAGRAEGAVGDTPGEGERDSTDETATDDGHGASMEGLWGGVGQGQGPAAQGEEPEEATQRRFRARRPR